jgi:hypothetical protein
MKNYRCGGSKSTGRQQNRFLWGTGSAYVAFPLAKRTHAPGLITYLRPELNVRPASWVCTSRLVIPEPLRASSEGVECRL